MNLEEHLEQKTIREVEMRGVPDVVPPKAIRIEKVNTNGATASPIAFANIKKNIDRGLPRLHHLPEFKKVKGFDRPIALVGGGPSLRDNLDELRSFKTVMSAGSAHDFIVKNGIIPTYSVVCDPDIISSYYLTLSDTETKYLISSHCHDGTFKMLDGKQIILWHCHSDDEYTNELIKIEKNYEGVGGGCTVGLRSLSIAIMLGYSNIHFFGFDSCVGQDDAAYSYAVDPRDNMLDLLGTIHQIRIGKDEPGDKVYRCLGYQIGQAQHFKDFYLRYKEFFKPTFHGRGLMKDMFEFGLE